MPAIPPTVGNKEHPAGLARPAQRKPCLTAPVLVIKQPVVAPIILIPAKQLVNKAVIPVLKVTPAPAVGSVAAQKTVRPIIRRKVRVLPPKPVIR